MILQCIFKPQVEDDIAKNGLDDGVPVEKYSGNQTWRAGKLTIGINHGPS